MKSLLAKTPMTKQASQKSGTGRPGPKVLIKQTSDLSSSTADIHNLVDDVALRPDLGVIVEGESGEQFFGKNSDCLPSPGRPRQGTRRGLARLTTDEFKEQQDMIQMQKSMKLIRRESILRIPMMNAQEKANIRGRIFVNEDITQAKARQVSRAATTAEKRNKFSLDRAHSIVDHYNSDVNQFNDRMHIRAEKLRPRKPQAPSLQTMKRANDRSRPRNWNVVRGDRLCTFNKTTIEHFQASLPKDAVKHMTPFRLYGLGLGNSVNQISIHEPDMFGQALSNASPERTMLRERPNSAMPLIKVRKSKKKIPKKFTNYRDQENHVEHMVSSSDLTARCSCCQQGEAKHHWPENKKIKFCRRIPQKTLRRLYGSQAQLLGNPLSKKAIRPSSAFPPVVPEDMKL